MFTQAVRFIARPHLIMNAMHHMAIRPSVCPFVGSGQAGVVAKPLNVSSKVLPPSGFDTFVVSFKLNVITKFGRAHS